MKVWGIGALLVGMLPGSALAETQSETLFKHKNWEVEVVSYDDGSLACFAEVDATTDSFTVWVYPDSAVKLQFYSTSWEFGEGDTANLEVEIDNRSPWTLTNAVSGAPVTPWRRSSKGAGRRSGFVCAR